MVLVAIASAFLSAAALSGNAAKAEVIVLGAPISLSGSYAKNGAFMRDGYKFAVQSINRAGGVVVRGKPYKLELKFYDDRSRPDLSAAIAEKLIEQDRVRFLLGPYSTDLTEAVAPVAERYRVPLISGNAAGRSLYDKHYCCFFAVLSSTDRYFTALFASAKRILKTEKRSHSGPITLAIATRGDRFSQDVRASVLADAEKNGMRLVLDDRLPDPPTDLSSTLARVRVLKPDIMVVSGRERGAIEAVNQFDAADIDVPILAVSHCDSSKIIEQTGKAAEGIYCPMQWIKSAAYRGKWFGSAANFARHFEQKYGYEPPYHAAQSAAAVVVYADALERAESIETEEVLDKVGDTKLDTFYGPVAFGPSGENIAKEMVVTRVVGGRHVVIQP
ncbi:amino acid ABC transporter substrate-binding protein [Methyloligella sp. GL2]|nr:amino acid ABC transporter substrate-binding protein [Methyloligella sp. GL2]